MNRNVTLQNNPISIIGKFPQIGDKAPLFRLVAGDLTDVSLNTFGKARKILNIFPSIDTSVCANSVRKFSQNKEIENTVILCISADLPFSLSRFCCAEHIENVIALSTMRGVDFGHDYGVRIIDGPLEGINARAVIVLDENNYVIHSELVSEITHEPDYDAAISSLK